MYNNIQIVAPEIFATYINKAEGYSFEIDWWSLGITVCEMVRGKVSFSVHRSFFYCYSNQLWTCARAHNYVP